MKLILSVNSIAQCIESIRKNDIVDCYAHSIAQCKYSIANIHQST